MTDLTFCIEAVEDAMARFGKPEISAQCQRHCRDNIDQGSQFTCHRFAGLLIAADIRIWMDGTGARHDDVFVVRLLKSVKYEEVDLRTDASVSEACASIGRYLDFDNGRRPHQGWAKGARGLEGVFDHIHEEDGRLIDDSCFVRIGEGRRHLVPPPRFCGNRSSKAGNFASHFSLTWRMRLMNIPSWSRRCCTSGRCRCGPA